MKEIILVKNVVAQVKLKGPVGLELFVKLTEMNEMQKCKTCNKVYSSACDYRQGRCPHHPALFGNLLSKLGIENEYTLTNMKILCVKNYYSNSKTQKELNIVFNPIDNAISDSLDWFKSKGRIKD